MNEIKAMSVLMGTDGGKVEDFVKAVINLAVDQGVAIEVFAVALASIAFFADGVVDKCKTMEEFREKLEQSGVANFGD